MVLAIPAQNVQQKRNNQNLVYLGATNILNLFQEVAQVVPAPPHLVSVVSSRSHVEQEAIQKTALISLQQIEH